MASSPITSWQIDGKRVETVADFIFLDSQITAEGDCSHEIKRCLLLERKVMINLDSILKSRDITLSTMVHIVKTMVFPVVAYGCESWNIRKAEPKELMLFNMLSKLIITFLSRSKHLLISWLQSPSAVILEPQKIKSDTISTVCPSIFHGVMGPDAMIFVF